MDYEKKYNEALKIAKDNYIAADSANINVNSFKNTLIAIFPELKESEDDRISGEIRDFICRAIAKGSITKEELEKSNSWLAWFGKQRKSFDEEKTQLGIRKDVALSIMEFLNRNTFDAGLSDMEYADLEDGVINSDWQKVYDCMKNRLEKQVKQKLVKKYGITGIGSKYAEGKLGEMIKEKIETENIESPLVVGDWIVKKYGGNFHDGRNFAKITEIDGDGRYWLDCGTWLRPNEIRRWTLKDAKAGDVLVSSINKPFIYNGHFDEDTVGAYCGLNVNNEFIIPNSKYFWTTNVNIRPTTKGQYNFLFQKMHAAAWDWDVEKKELKSHYKCEVNPHSKTGLEMTT